MFPSPDRLCHPWLAGARWCGGETGLKILWPRSTESEGSAAPPVQPPAHHTWLLLRRGCCQWCEHCTVTCRLLVLTSIEIYGYLPKWAFTCSFFIAKIQNTTCQGKISWESLPNSLCIHIHHSIDVKICQLSSEWCQYDRGHDRGRRGCYSDHQNPVVS